MRAGMKIQKSTQSQKSISPSINEVRIYSTDQTAKAKEVLHEIRTTLAIQSISNIKMIKVYRVENTLPVTLEELTKKILCNTIYQTYVINKPVLFKAQKVLEVAYKPGVMNPEVNSILTIAKELNIQIDALEISREYHFFGNPTQQEIQTIVERLLVNKTVQRIITEPITTLQTVTVAPTVQTINVSEMNADQLQMLSKNRQLHLNIEEMHVIQKHFQTIDRNPTDAELETIAQTWSEHCYHKTFKAKLIVDGKEKEPLYSRLKKVSKKYNTDVVSAFVDNAGAYRFYDGYAVLGKVETHNSPSAIEPYGGAATGSGGVFRDIMGTGQGAKVIASTDMFCFGPPNLDEKELPPGCLHPNYLLRNVVAGVRDYGNRMGIPTNNGSVHFHKNFRAKPTVIVGAYGIAPEKYCHKKEPQPEDIIFTVGGKTGRDGIHGATFSSGQMTSETKSVNASAVQIGNPIEEKRLTDALLAARNLGLIRTLTDCGAGGFSSAIGEMASTTGAYIDLAKAPLKYSGLAPWEIWISESQERMVCAIEPKDADAFIKLCAEHNVEATAVGHFTNTKQLTVVYEDQFVCDLEMDFLHEGLPQRIMVATKEVKKIKKQTTIPVPINWEQVFCNIMSHLNVCSKESIVRQYDHGVQGTNVLPPFAGKNHNGPNDAVILRPLLDKPYGMIIAHGMNPQLNMIDPYKGGVWAITEALANLVAVGGDPKTVALIDNFIWPFPDEHSLWDLDASLDACVEGMHAFELPFISGKDSLSSTYRYPDGKVLKIPPVLCISAFGKIKNIEQTISADFKQADSVIALLGTLDVQAMGGSCYEDVLNIKTNRVPTIDMKKTKLLFEKLHKLIKQNYILACHDISEGGIAVALAEMCFGGDLGTTIDITKLSLDRPDYALFNETAGCFLAEIKKEDVQKLKEMDIKHAILGATTKNKAVTINHQEKQLFTIKLEKLLKAWQQPLKKVFRT